MLNNHMHKWEEEVYQQSKGEQIGLRASGTMAKAAMEEWMWKFQEKFENLGFKVHLLVKYVDDCVIVIDNAKLGDRFIKDKLINSAETVGEDRLAGLERSKVTLRILT